MSNKTQLQANNTQLASLIQALQGKAAGGGASVETCTVTVRFTGNAAGFGEGVGYKVYYTKVVGTATEASYEQYATDELVLNDALKGSMANVLILDNIDAYGFNLTAADNVSCVDNAAIGMSGTLLCLFIADSGAIVIS